MAFFKAMAPVLAIAQRYSLLIVLLLLTAWCYYPALYSGFFIDDFYNLLELQEVKNHGWLYYVLSGFSGPSGRPLALLSFALQYEAWPEDPFAFKLVNLSIHLGNGILIWLISQYLIKTRYPDSRRQHLFALLVTAIWLLHPLQLTTVLYTVQRMTQLAALFSLLGIYSYLRFRIDKLATRQYHYYLLTITIWACTVAAILSKENGVLILLFIIIIEATLLARQTRPKQLKPLIALCLIAPLLLLAGYLIAIFDYTLASYAARPYTMGERLLTQSVVLITYLKNILLPSYGAFSLFHDNFPISTGLLSPPHTLLAVVFITAAFFYALLKAKTSAVLSFAILWFLGGHLLESSYLNLELYFEHRNYLPSFGIIFALVYLLLSDFKRPYLRIIAAILMLFYLLLVASIFFAERNNWAQPIVQAIEWAKFNPQSERSLENLAAVYRQHGQFQQAEKIYQQLQAKRPDDIYPSLHQLRINNCERNIINDSSDWQAVIAQAESAKPYGLATIATIDALITETIAGHCNNELDYVNDLLAVLLTNPQFGHLYTYLYEAAAIIEFQNKNQLLALDYIDKIIAAGSNRVSVYLLKFLLLKTLGRDEEFLAFREHMKQQRYHSPRQYILYYRTMKSLDYTLG